MRKYRDVAIVCLLVAFFAFVGYRTLIHNPADAVEDKLEHTIAAHTTKASAQTPTSQEYGYKRAQIAMQEYDKNIWETPRGCNCGPEIDQYTQGLHQQWCTMFVSWVTMKAGSPLKDDKTGSWKLTNSRQLAEYLQKHGTWFSQEEILKENLKPRIGDIVIFWRGDFEDNLGHATIVIDGDTGDGTADLVGGNQKDRVALSKSFPWMHNYGLLGFGRPEKD